MNLRAHAAPARSESNAVLDVHGAHLQHFVINVERAAITAQWSEAGKTDSDEFVIPLSERGVTIQITLKPQSDAPRESVSLDTLVPQQQFGVHITVKPAHAA